MSSPKSNRYEEILLRVGGKAYLQDGNRENEFLNKFAKTMQAIRPKKPGRQVDLNARDQLIIGRIRKIQAFRAKTYPDSKINRDLPMPKESASIREVTGYFTGKNYLKTKVRSAFAFEYLCFFHKKEAKALYASADLGAFPDVLEQLEVSDLDLVDVDEPNGPLVKPSGPFVWPKYLTKQQVGDLNEVARAGENVALWLNPHNHYSIPFKGRSAELAMLNDFMALGGKFRIAFVIAPSGAGKTRLISEWMRPYVAKTYEVGERKKNGWDAGFIHNRDPSVWNNWEPENNTLLVVDYTYNYGEVIAAIKKQAEQQADEISKEVRLVLIDHIDPQFKHQDIAYGQAWGDYRDPPTPGTDPKRIVRIALGQNDQSRDFLADIAAGAANLFTGAANYDREHPQIQMGIKALLGSDQSKKITGEASSRQNSTRSQPLFAALMGQSLAVDPHSDVSKLKRADLITQYFDPPHRLPWKKSVRNAHWEELGKWAGCIVSAATLLRGLDFDGAFDCVYERGQAALVDNQQVDDLRQLCERLVSSEGDGFVKPYEPDLLGETFLLKFLHDMRYAKDVKDTLASIITTCVNTDTKEKSGSFIETITRLTQNLINFDQRSSHAKYGWAVLHDLLNPTNFLSGPTSSHFVSHALGEVVRQLQDAKLDEKAFWFAKLANPIDLVRALEANYPATLEAFIAILEQLLRNATVSEGWEAAITSVIDGPYNRPNYGLPSVLVMAEMGATSVLIKAHGMLGLDLNWTDAKGYSATFNAAKRGNLDCLKWLVENGARLGTSTSRIGLNELMVAAQNDQAEVVQYLTEQELVDVNAHSPEYGATALMIASIRGNARTVKSLLASAPIDVNRGGLIDGITPLMLACQEGHLEVVDELLKTRSIDLNKSAFDDRHTALWAACRNGHTTIVDRLIKDDRLDLNLPLKDDGLTPLIDACMNGDLAVAGLLCRAPQINLDQATTKGVTALMACSHQGHYRLVDLLLSSSEIDVNKTLPAIKATPLMFAAKAGHTGCVLRLLLDYRVKIDLADHEEKTALFHAVQQAHYAIADLIRLAMADRSKLIEMIKENDPWSYNYIV